jgi:hypothetical protein
MGKCAGLWKRVVDVAMFLFIGIDKFGVDVAGRGELINSHGGSTVRGHALGQ